LKSDRTIVNVSAIQEFTREDDMRRLAPLLLVAVAATSRAQSLASDTGSSRGEPQRLPVLGRNSRRTLIAVAGAGVAIALFDSRLVAGTERWEDRKGLGTTATIGSFIGGPVPVSLGAVLYALGRGTSSSTMAQTGREVIRAVLVSGGLTAVAKGIVGRKRPFASPGDADQFEPGLGFSNPAFASFPSGHTSAAFATATVLARELNVHHPQGGRVLNPLLFAGATLVGFARIYERQHWPSDVVAGAALGTVSGFEVVAHARGDRSPIWSSFASHLAVGRNRQGTTVGWVWR